MPVLLWSLSIVHRSKNHKPNVVGVRNLVDLRVCCGCGFEWEECWPCEQSIESVWNVVSNFVVG